MKKVRIIGVPEHFNLPWHMAIEENAFKERGIDLEWTDIPEGTGKMSKMLADDETDLAIILTEGIVKSIVEGNKTKIVQEFIASPLLWGIHVATDSKHQKISDLENTKAAISRFGSGSHLMAYVLAKNEGWDLDKLQFEVIDNLEGAVKALAEQKADYFMWERFMTKPLVDQGIFRRIDDCPTPWPCFVIAVRNEFLENNPKVIEQILEIINTTTEEFKIIPSIDRTLASKYNQEVDAIQEWLKLTNWSQKQMTTPSFDKIMEQLLKLKIIDKKVAKETMLK